MRCMCCNPLDVQMYNVRYIQLPRAKGDSGWFKLRWGEGSSGATWHTDRHIEGWCGFGGVGGHLVNDMGDGYAAMDFVFVILGVTKCEAFFFFFCHMEHREKG